MSTAGVLGLVAIALATGCVDEAWRSPVTPEELIQELSIRPRVGDSVPADGSSMMIVKLVTAGGEGRDPALQAVLQVSDGQWKIPDSGAPKTKTLKNVGEVVEVELVAGTTPGPITVTATVKDHTRPTAFELRAVTADDVFAGGVTVMPPAGGAIADGMTPIDFTVCATGAKAAEPGSMVDLRASGGVWIGAQSADPRLLQLPLAGTCVTGSLLPGLTPTPIVVTATIGRFMRSVVQPLAMAPIGSVACSVGGGLATATGSGTITLNARVFAAGIGKPSTGPQVTYRATIEPATAAGYFTKPVTVLEASDQTSTELIVYGHPTRITLTAEAVAGQGAAVACPPVVVTAPPPAP